MKNRVIIAFSTCSDGVRARALAEELVASGLAACVNLVPGVTSIFRWEGRVQTDEECLMMVKTRPEALPAIREWILERHPYELPELVAVDVSGGLPEYIDWVADAVRPDSE